MVRSASSPSHVPGHQSLDTRTATGHGTALRSRLTVTWCVSQPRESDHRGPCTDQRPRRMGTCGMKDS